MSFAQVDPKTNLHDYQSSNVINLDLIPDGYCLGPTTLPVPKSNPQTRPVQIDGGGGKRRRRAAASAGGGQRVTSLLDPLPKKGWI
jgi:hypothetical protein